MFARQNLPVVKNDSRPEATMIHASQLSGAQPTGDYSWRPPSPPHIHVPQGFEDNKPVALPAYNGIGSEGGQYEEFLKAIVQAPQDIKPLQDWKYEFRRHAQSILPYLYLGPSSAARDIDYLKSEGITMLLVIRDTKTAQARMLSGDKVAQQLGIQSAAVDVTGNPELIAGWPRAIKIINDHLVSNLHKSVMSNPNSILDPLAHCGKVLVFCESGNERSASVVIAYMMNMYGLSVITGIQYLHTRRFCTCLDDNLKNLLWNYMEVLNAKRQVSSVPQSSQPQLTAPKHRAKRGRGDDEDADVMEMEDDEQRFQGRSGFVPFK